MPTVRSGDARTGLSRRTAPGRDARLPARSRRDAGCGDAGHHGRARRRLPDRRWVLPPRQLLRALGLPHHLAPDRRMAEAQHHQAGRLLGPPGPAVVARPLLHADRRLGHLRRLRPRRHLPDPAGRRALRTLLLRQLALHRVRLELLPHDRPHVTADPHVVPGRGGAVLPGLAAGLPRRHEAHAFVAGASPRRRRGRARPRPSRWRCSSTPPTSTVSTSAPTPMRSPCWWGPRWPSACACGPRAGGRATS